MEDLFLIYILHFGIPAAPFEVDGWDTEWGNDSALTRY